MRRFQFRYPQRPSRFQPIEQLEIIRNRLRRLQATDDESLNDVRQLFDQLRESMLSGKANIDTPAPSAMVPVVANSAAACNDGRRQGFVQRKFVFEGVFGDSPPLLDALEVAERAAPTDLPVLIYGESGTGKELMAKVVHANGPRAAHAFVAVNCGAIPEHLFEAELFGHRKGAFTGAHRDRLGHFEAANGGTLFLDEIGELPLAGQVKLLRALQSQEIQRVGEDQSIQVDVRIVAATNRDLRAEVEAGRFREDLYYRLSVIDLTLPPLRERRDEIPLLINYFLAESTTAMGRKAPTLSPALNNFFASYAFPGNIRELQNLIDRIVCLADENADVCHLPSSLQASAHPTFAPSTRLFAPSLTDIRKHASDRAEREYLVQMLRENAGRVVDLASNIGMNRSHVQTLLKKHGLNAKSFRVPRQ